MDNTGDVRHFTEEDLVDNDALSETKAMIPRGGSGLIEFDPEPNAKEGLLYLVSVVAVNMAAGIPQRDALIQSAT